MSGDVGRLLDGLAGPDGVDAADGGAPLEAMELVTTGDDGWPHVAWLSAGEVLVTGPTALAICLWPGSTTTANLRRHGKALLQAVAGGTVVKLRLDATALGDIAVGDEVFAGFLAEVVDAGEDRAAYAEVLSGLTYRLHDPGAVTARWRRQLDALAAVVAGETR